MKGCSLRLGDSNTRRKLVSILTETLYRSIVCSSVMRQNPAVRCFESRTQHRNTALIIIFSYYTKTESVYRGPVSGKWPVCVRLDFRTRFLFVQRDCLVIFCQFISIPSNVGIIDDGCNDCSCRFIATKLSLPKVDVGYLLLHCSDDDCAL